MSRNSTQDQRLHVKAKVNIGGKNTTFVSLQIEQEYGQHHKFSIFMDYDALGHSFMNAQKEQIDLIGKIVRIDLQHGEDIGSAYIFRGIVTKVKITGKNGKHGPLVVEGASPTIAFDRGRRTDVYSDMTLRKIFDLMNEGTYHEYIKLVNKPTFENKINFLMQYNETDWEFMQRIAYQYGENLFYSGYEILFGEYKEWDTVPLTYDKEITDIQFCSHMLPNEFTSYIYQVENDSILERESPDDIENSNVYLDKVAEKNRILTLQKNPKAIINAPITEREELDEMVKRRKTRTAAQTIYIIGKAKTYEPYIGRLINISIPEEMGKKDLGTYRVTKSIHKITQNLEYENDFEAVPAKLKTMPISEPKIPTADSVLATVSSNEDPKGIGRVQVEFPFATQYSKIWMRVMTPSAGSSDAIDKNRGIVFIPEKGDQVMVGFEFGDPNRPYVMGSMFHGNNGKGGESNNAIKNIITRSGLKIVFNDDEGSLHIEDPSGNTWDLDGKGNIGINAPKNMTIKVGENMDVTVSKNISISVGENIKVDVGKNIEETAGGDINQTATGNISETADNKTEKISEDYSRISKNSNEIAQKVMVFSEKENMTLQSGKTVLFNSAEKSNLF